MFALAFHEPDKIQESYNQMQTAALGMHPLDADTEPWYRPEE